MYCRLFVVSFSRQSKNTVIKFGRCSSFWTNPEFKVTQIAFQYEADMFPESKTETTYHVCNEVRY